MKGPLKSTLEEMKGIPQPPMVNPYGNSSAKIAPRLTAEEYVEGIFAGERPIVSRAITLIESSLSSDRNTAGKIVKACRAKTAGMNTMRIGITGVPGAGKSTFIESFGKLAIKAGHKLAVLTVDPSSEISGGSILGDKTRMETLANEEKAFIRPSPSAGSLGGVARKTRETIAICEAAGFDTVFIETVGVGQSETAVHSMSDFFLLLLLSGAGDELQGIKRGIIEMADLITVNKADGSNTERAECSKNLYDGALHLFPPTRSGWKPSCVTSSALTGAGLEDIWKMILNYFSLVMGNGYYLRNRREQDRYWMHESINESLKSSFYGNPEIAAELPEIEKEVLNGNKDSFEAAEELLTAYNKKL
ncbi:MAG: methylmalonyl Co-A mutase-associated GTPase MeaB [Bacteroidales bacterium]|jgi:LAO/AO transport system kinase|nr:methylmalonyl Co-A mutase-associated GTPase MeaB [Bacteroidales bacterium]MCI2121886.1 methylmalonyl Co-A mutase-associated GTPase MeaB [Bacteroidales bacterium]MCI2145658.1 methylmalonyl Co-A mutase-associated GTPase MeaB [Bacteroidales bacterium]